MLEHNYKNCGFIVDGDFIFHYLKKRNGNFRQFTPENYKSIIEEALKEKMLGLGVGPMQYIENNAETYDLIVKEQTSKFEASIIDYAIRAVNTDNTLSNSLINKKWLFNLAAHIIKERKGEVAINILEGQEVPLKLVDQETLEKIQNTEESFKIADLINPFAQQYYDRKIDLNTYKNKLNKIEKVLTEPGQTFEQKIDKINQELNAPEEPNQPQTKQQQLEEMELPRELLPIKNTIQTYRDILDSREKKKDEERKLQSLQV